MAPTCVVVALLPSIVEPICTYVDVALIIVEPTHGIVAPRIMDLHMLTILAQRSTTTEPASHP
jgi:hypothetical protein